LDIRLLNVECEDHLVCRFFPYTFESKSSRWYFNLSIESNSNQNDFENEFIGKFVDESTPFEILK